MQLKERVTNAQFSNKNRVDHKKFFKEYVGNRFENKIQLQPLINQLRIRNYKNVNDYLNYLLDQNPNNIDLLRFGGEFLFTYHRYLAAWEHYDQILKVIPDDLESLSITSICSYILDENYQYRQRINQLRQHRNDLADKIEKYIYFINKYNHLTIFPQQIVEKDDLDLIVLYGEIIPKNGHLSDDLLARLERTLELAKKHPKAEILALGGNVHNQYYEGLVNYHWLINQGLEEHRIILDMSGLDVVIQSESIGDLLMDQRYRNLVIISNFKNMPRRYLSLQTKINLLGQKVEKIKSISLKTDSYDYHPDNKVPNYEILKSWHTTFRTAGIFEETFYQ